MKYGVIVSRPNFLPYVIPVDEPSAAVVTTVTDNRELLCPLFVVDFESGEMFRVFEGENGYELSDRVTEKFGFLTKREPNQRPTTMEL